MDFVTNLFFTTIIMVGISIPGYGVVISKDHVEMRPQGLTEHHEQSHNQDPTVGGGVDDPAGPWA